MFGVQYCQVVSSLQKHIKKQNNIFCYDFAETDEKFYVIQAMFPHENIDKRWWIRLSVSAYKLSLHVCIHKKSPEEYESWGKKCQDHNHEGFTIWPTSPDENFLGKWVRQKVRIFIFDIFIPIHFILQPSFNTKQDKIWHML